MLRKISILFIATILISFSSCVSKKKFLEMETGRLKAEKLSQDLNNQNNQKAERIKALIADFESMKNDLLENNAIKNHTIDSLNGEIFTLLENLNKQKESLQETSFNLDFEQQRLTNALNAKDKTIGSLQSEVDKLEREISEKNSIIDQKNFDLGRSKEETKVLEGKVQTGDKKIAEMQVELQKIKTETSKLMEQIKEKDATITKLENNVKLLKKELGN